MALKTAQTGLETAQVTAEADITEIQTGQATLEAQDTAISEQISALETGQTALETDITAIRDTEIPDAIAGVRPTLLLKNHSLTIAGTNVLAQTLVTAKA